MKVVQNIMLKSEQIVEILSGTGLKLEEIAAAAPRLQVIFISFDSYTYMYTRFIFH